MLFPIRYFLGWENVITEIFKLGCQKNQNYTFAYMYLGLYLED